MKLGILGGIGPEASACVYTEIIHRLRESGGIRRNADYPHIIINSINAPELVSLEVDDEQLTPYINGIKELASAGVDYIVMACNTIHLFRERLIVQSGFSGISDISAIVSKALNSTQGSLCVLGTPATISSGLYTFLGRSYINPEGEELSELASVVVNYNATGETLKNQETLMRIAQSCKQRGASIFIAGCTEISELLRGEKEFELIDTLELLIEDTFQLISKS